MRYRAPISRSSPSESRTDDKIVLVGIAYVKLDKSGKTLRFRYEDCTPV